MERVLSGKPHFLIDPDQFLLGETYFSGQQRVIAPEIVNKFLIYLPRQWYVIDYSLYCLDSGLSKGKP